MNWYRNLDTTPRLMIGFGITLALTIIMGSLAIANLTAANNRVAALYQSDLEGGFLADSLAYSQTTIGKKSRDAIVHLDNAKKVREDEGALLDEFAKIHANLEEAPKYFYSPEGKALLADIVAALPVYEQAYRAVIPYLDAKDARGATIALDKTTSVSDPLVAALAHAKAVKRQRAREKFEANEREYQQARSLILGFAALALLLGAVLSIVIARGFSVPLGEAVTTLEQMAGGDLTVSLEVHTRDEVGRMAAALNDTILKLRTTLLNVSEGASNANAASQELSAAADTLASGAQKQAASLEQTSASLEEIAATVRQSADGARQANQLASASREVAQGGQGVVVNAIKAMEEINEASSKISNIISTIDEIAFQTNLLAVNAAVEAARAGEQGRGFAVVAAEVRSLAQRSAGAAKEIKSLIQDSLGKVEKGSGLVNRSGETLQSIVVSVKKVTDVVGEISNAVDEQTIGIDQVNTAVTQIDQVTQSNAAQTEELSSTARSLADQSGQLMKLVSVFTLGAEDPAEAPVISRPQTQPRSLPKPRGTRPRSAYTPKAQPHTAVPAALLAQAGAASSQASFEEF